MKRVPMSVTEEMMKALQQEKKKRMLGSLPETVRAIISDYLASQKKEDSALRLKNATKTYRS